MSKSMEMRPELERTCLRIFISFRGDPSGKRVRHLKRRLERHFPLAYVFASNASLREDGKPWEEEIRKAIFSSNAFVAVLDREWKDHVRDPESVVRWETEAALRNPNIVRCFIFRLSQVSAPSPDELPPSIKPLLTNHFPGSSNRPSLNQFNRLVAALTQAEAELLKQNTMPIAFVSSALAQENDTLAFFSLIVSEVVQQASDAGLPMNVVVRIPKMGEGRDATASSQREILNDVLASASRYRAIIINPFLPEGLERMVRDFRQRYPHFPLFTVDQCLGAPPWTTGHDRSAALPRGVMCNWYLGGRLAGEMLSAYLKLVRVERPLIWVLVGNRGTEARQQGFSEVISEKLGEKAEIEFFEGKFRQDEARKRISEEWKQRGELPHAVFCTNDEMALGAHEALDTIEREFGTHRARVNATADPTFGVKIVGFDAIHDLTTRIAPPQDGRPKYGTFYLNTVNVKVKEQARKVIEMVTECLREPASIPAERIVDIVPEPYVGIENQNARTLQELRDWPNEFEEYRLPRRGKTRNGRNPGP